MHRQKPVLVLGCWLIAWVCAIGQDDAKTPRTFPPQTGARDALAAAQPPAAKQDDKGKKDDKTKPPQIDLTAVAPQTSESSSGFSPQMMGDFKGGLASLILVPVVSKARLLAQGEGQIVTITDFRAVRVPFAGRGGFKLGENENVMPGDRSFFTYNYYDNVQGGAQGSDKPITVLKDVVFNGQTFPAEVSIPGVPPPRLDVHRETIGFEKSFCNGRFSVGARLPLFQQNGADQFHDHDLGDLTLIAKYAPFLERESGSGISVGLAVTVPTGPAIHTLEGDIHDTLLQPFVGYQYNTGNLLLYGFTSVVIPTDPKDITLLFNDIGIGYRLWERDGLVRTLIPAIEAHVTTPLDRRKPTDLIQGSDLVVLTGGIHVGLGERSLLTLGVATPVTGPRPYGFEGIVQFNFRF